ncbi:maleylpyruvate isomerase N-terminal domain-containing protein [Kutzneria sp. NPDC052558]|uniref:maleylpyruvate isomerase N-terminal domain-containing protein n=1 Tax=Kutzneria sp. NPDC052558 TaxID=3364121 RepID=UPI0037CBEAB7
MTDVVGALKEECGALLGVLGEVTEFGVLTNCPPWDLGELVVHMGDSVRLKGRLPHGEERANLVSAADYYRRAERGTVEYRQGNVDRTRELAGEVLARESAVGWFERVAREAVGLFEGDDLGRVVEVRGKGAMRLGDWVATRVIAVAAHGVDVAITLGREPWTTEAALGVVRPVFVELLGEEPSEELGWSDQEFLVVGTGRRELTESEREVLGERGEKFPLLS